MQIGYIGLGKMGKNMVLRLLEQGVAVVAWNRSPEPRQAVASQGAQTAEDMVDVVDQLTVPRLIWLMLPAGDVTGEAIHTLLPKLSSGDVLIDGANSLYKDTQLRAKEITSKGVRFLDVGVSGGPVGARDGACLMVGGEHDDYTELTRLWEVLAAPKAYGYFGDHGAGHFVKMVHNGIEYGMMQAIAEGAAVLKKSPYQLDLAEVFRVYNQRSVIESRLVEWGYQALHDDPKLSNISSQINHSGEGEWTIQAAHELGIEVPVIEKSFQVRVDSTMKSEEFRDKMVSALRGQFGGHAVEKIKFLS